MPNTGGGGGGCSTGGSLWGGGNGRNGGSGGSGVVILRFALDENENVPGIAESENFTTNFFYYNTGGVFTKYNYTSVEDSSLNYSSNVFTDSVVVFLNYDTSAEIKYSTNSTDNLSLGEGTTLSGSNLNYPAGVYNIILDKPEPPSPPVKYVVFQRVTGNFSRECAIGEIECVLNDNTNVALASNGATAEVYEDFSITDNVASWSTVNTFMGGWTNGNYWADKAINGTTGGNYLHINHGSLLVSTVITLQNTHVLDSIQYLYVYNRAPTQHLRRMTEHRFVLLDENKNVLGTTDEITEGELEFTFNYSDFTLFESPVPFDVSTNIKGK